MKIINRGVELALGFRSDFSETFQWDFGGNISYIYNTVQDLPFLYYVQDHKWTGLTSVQLMAI